jgi:hypothetical protein
MIVWARRVVTLTAMSNESNQLKRPSYAPENRSKHGGKFLAVGVFVLLLLASAVSIYVVVNRGSAGIVLKHAPAPQEPPIVAPSTQ